MPVHPSIAAGLLTWAAGIDNRTVTESAAIAWAASLDDRVTLPDGQAALTAHYARTRDFAMPSDVNREVKTLRDARLHAMKTPEPPETIDADDVPAQLAWGRAYRAAIGDGHDDARADAIACATVGVERPAQIATTRPVDAVVSTLAATTRLPRRAA